MTADLDAELEQVTRQAFARMFGVVEITPPEEMPDLTTTTLIPLDGGGSPGHRPPRRRRRNVALAAAAVAAVAAVVVAVVVVPGLSSDDRVSTTTPSTTAPSTTDSTVPATTSSTAPPGPDGTEGTTGGSVAGDWPGSGEVRAAEIRGLLDPATSDVPLDRLADVVELPESYWPVILQAADDGHEIALQLTAPGDTGFGSGIEGTPQQLQTHWMVNAVVNRFVVWGLVPSDVASVTISTKDGASFGADTVPVGPSELQSRAFAVILPQLAYIDGVSGELADGTVSLAGVELEASLVQFQQHSPFLLEWTGFIPVVQH